MSDSSKLLQKLKEYSNDTLNNILIPSTGKKAKFKNLTIRQQKNIIKTAGDGIISGATLNQAINDIVFETCEDKDIEFSILDRYPVILSLRVSSIGDEIKIDDKKISLKDHIADCVDKIKEKEYNPTHECSLSDIKINLKIPSLKRDSAISEKFAKNNIKNKSEVGETIATLYVYEIVKFISTIELGEDVYDFYKMSVLDCVSIIESLPVSINNEILNYIESIRAIENLYLETEFGNIEIDAGFFSAA